MTREAPIRLGRRQVEERSERVNRSAVSLFIWLITSPAARKPVRPFSTGGSDHETSQKVMLRPRY
jgi:hypothetical protein